MTAETPLSLAVLLHSPISRERFAAYDVSSDHDTLDAVARYLWNMALGEALYPVLQALEVALRNGLNDELAALYGATWYDDAAVVVNVWGRKEIAEAKKTLSRFYKPHTPGRIVAELKFGFWTHLFNVDYERPVWQKLWSKPTVFRGVPRKHRKRRDLSTRLNGIRDFRNRVFHHEPIWHRQDLTRLHNDMLETLGWLSPAMRDTTQVLDRFPTVHSRGPQAFRPALEALCQRQGYVP